MILSLLFWRVQIESMLGGLSKPDCPEELFLLIQNPFLDKLPLRLLAYRSLILRQFLISQFWFFRFLFFFLKILPFYFCNFLYFGLFFHFDRFFFLIFFSARTS